jgi:CSLREA domain-containing protein
MKQFSRLLGRLLTASLLAFAITGPTLVSTVRAASQTFTVNDLNDGGDGICDGSCTLREAIFNANASADADTIVFVVSGTITLTSPLPVISEELTIDGSGQKVTISGGSIERIVTVNSNVKLTIHTITFKDGSDNVQGGAIFNNGTLVITNSTFINNKAPVGGAIYNSNVLEVSNSTFSGNSATSSYGGGIYNALGAMSLYNSTFSANSATISGGGIYNANGAIMNYANTIIANSAGGDCINAGQISTNTNNLVEDNSCAATSSGDPKLGTLADNGGSTLTFGLLPDSPARDAGSDAVCAAAPVNNLDQRGVTRPDGPHCDIGAFEAEFVSPLILNPSALDFGEQVVGTTSDAKTVTVTNASAASVSIGILNISGEFALASNNCNGKTLAQYQTCTFSVTFAPISDGSKTGTVTVPDNAATVLAALPLIGTGISPVVGLSATSLVFAPQFIGTTSAAQTVTLTNTGTGTLALGTLGITGDFSFRTNTCNGASLPATGTCKFSVAFSPRDIGIRKGVVTIPSNAATSPNMVTLRGTIKEGVQLLKMGNFDTLVYPRPWIIDTPLDKLINLRDHVVYLSPSYSAKFTGYRTNPTLTALQIVTRNGKVGDKFFISLSSRASLVPVGGQYSLTVLFRNHLVTVGSITLTFSSGTHNFQTRSLYYTAPAAYTHITFQFTYQKTSGTAWFDDAALILLP